MTSRTRRHRGRAVGRLGAAWVAALLQLGAAAAFGQAAGGSVGAPAAVVAPAPPAPAAEPAPTAGSAAAAGPAVTEGGPAAASGTAGPASATGPGIDRPPLPGAPRPIDVAVPTEQRLPNGLRVVVAERRGVQLVTAQLLVLAGSESDPADKAGLAAFAAALLTRGTRLHGAPELAQAAESLGGGLDSGAGWHQATVGMTVMTPKLDAALALVAEVARQPAFAPKEIERLRAQNLDELKVAYGNPRTLAGLASQQLLFGPGPYGHPAGGTPASLQRLQRADLAGWHAARFRPDAAVLVLAGDIDAATGRSLAERHFGSWRAEGAPPARFGGPANAERPQPGVVVDLPQSGQAAVLVATPLPPPGADRATAVVANAVLGGGFSSRLNQEIRIRRGLSYSAGSGLDLRPLGGALRAVVQTKNESAAEVVALVERQLDQLGREPVPTAELEARKATLIGEVSRSIETTAGLAATVVALLVDDRPLEELRTRIANLQAVDAAAVQRYAARQFGAAGRRVVVAGEAARFAPALRALMPGIGVVSVQQVVDAGPGAPRRAKPDDTRRGKSFQ